jgi:hypothetical protein
VIDGNDMERKEYDKWALGQITSPKVASLEELSSVTVDLVEQYFPKGKSKERSCAIVLHAKMLIAIHDLMTKGK